MPRIRPEQARRRLREQAAAPIGRVREGEPQPSGEGEVQGQALAQASGSLLSKITSQLAEERAWAMNSLARLIVEEPATFQVLLGNAQAMRDIVLCLRDGIVSVRVAASGILRNAVVVGGVRVVSQLQELGALPLLEAALKDLDASVAAALAPHDEDKVSPDQWTALVVQTFGLLGIMCEHSEAMTQAVVQGGLTPRLLALVRPRAAPLPVALASLQLLAVLTDDFPPASTPLAATPEALQLLKLTLANQQHPLKLRALAAAVLAQVVPSDSGLPALLAPTLRAALAGDAPSALRPLLPPLDAGHDILTGDQQAALNTWSTAAEAAVMVLEVVANLLAPSEEGEEDEFELGDQGEGGHEDQGGTALPLPPALIEWVGREGIPNLALSRAAFPPSSLVGALPRHLRHLLDLLLDGQLRAAAVLLNLIAGLPLPSLGDVAGLWGALFTLVRTAFSPDWAPLLGPELPDALLSALAVLARRTTVPLEGWQLDAALALTRHERAAVRAESLVLLGQLGARGSLPRSAEVGSVLVDRVQALLGDPDATVQLEAIDAAFALFDDHYDEAVLRTRLVPQLKQLAAALTQRYRTEQKRPPAERDRALLDRLDEARVNLPRFVQYKEAQRKGF